MALDKDMVLDAARKAIHIEALALKHLEASLGEEFVRAVEIILESKGKLIVTGMGKSGHIGCKLAATFASTGTPSFFLHPAEAFHGDLGMISKEDVVLALSYSGETDEVPPAGTVKSSAAYRSNPASNSYAFDGIVANWSSLTRTCIVTPPHSIRWWKWYSPECCG